MIDSWRRATRFYERMHDGAFATRGSLTQLDIPSLVDRGMSIEDVYRDTTVPELLDIRRPL